MTIQRAILKGTLLNLVQTRAMFTADVTSQTHELDASLWQAYISSIFTEVRTILASSAVTTTIEYQDLVDGEWVTWGEEECVWSGTASGDPLPNQNALVLIAKGAAKWATGKKFFSGLAESQIVGNSMINDAVIAAAAALLAYITPYTGQISGDHVPGILNKDGEFVPFVGGLVSSLIGSQRRRKPGNGM